MTEKKRAPKAIGADQYYTVHQYKKIDNRSTEQSFYRGLCIGIVLCGVTILFILHYVAGIL